MNIIQLLLSGGSTQIMMYIDCTFESQDTRKNSIPDAVVNVGNDPSRVSVRARPDSIDCCRSTSLLEGASRS